MTTTPTASPELPDLDALLADHSSAVVNYAEHGDIGGYYNDMVGAGNAIRDLFARRTKPEGEAPQAECPQAELAVWEGPMPESNGRQNYTAVLHRKESTGFDLFTDGFQFARSEYPDRTRYEADFMRWLIGERDVKPELWDDCYDMDKRSGYVAPAEAAVDECYPQQGSPHASVNDRIGAARIAFRRGYRAALAAQSQGAQAAPGEALRLLSESIPFRLDRIAKGECVDASVAAIRNALPSIRAALAAKAEAPMTYDEFFAEARRLKCKLPDDVRAELAASSDLAAQQAAAPGALLEILRDVHDTLASESDSDIDHFEDDEEEREGAPVQYAARKVMEVMDMLKAAPSAPGTPEAPAVALHPLQPLVEDAYGRVRFKRNAIVDHLATDRLNDLAAMNFSEDDWEQLAQLIGYSLDGFGTLSYVKDETYERAAAQPVVQRAAQLDGGQGGSAT